MSLETLRSVQLEIVQAAALLCDFRERPSEHDVAKQIDQAVEMLDRANSRVLAILENKPL